MTRVRIVRMQPPDPGGPQMPNTYVPPRMLDRTGWNAYYPTTWQELQDLADGTTTVTRPAVIYLDPAITYEKPSAVQSDVLTFEPQGDEANGWLYVMPLEVNYANIAAEGTRIDSSYAADMPMLRGRGVNSVIFQLNLGCRRIRFVGLQCTYSDEADISNSMIYVTRELVPGDVTPSSESDWCREIVFDRCWIYGNNTDWFTNQREGLSICGNQIAVIESRFEWIRSSGESKGIWVLWSSRQVTVWNNYIDCVSAGFFTGGTRNAFEGQFEDVDVRYNEFTKSKIWKSDDPSYVGRRGGLHKNHFELKGGVRVYCAFNYLHGQYYIDDNQGHAFTIKNDSYGGVDPYRELTDIIIEWNDSRDNPHVCYLIGADGGDEVARTARVAVRNNFLQANNGVLQFLTSSVIAPAWNPSYRFEDVIIENNTYIGQVPTVDENNAGTALNFGTHSDPGEFQFSDLTYRNNLSGGGIYGVWMNAGPNSSTAILANACEQHTMEENVIWELGPDNWIDSPGWTDAGTINDVGFAQTSDVFGSWAVTGQYASHGCDYDQLMTNTQIARTGVRF